MPEAALEPLARSLNLRDLGGIPAGEGRQVRRGTLYRSAALGELTAPERAALSSLGVRTVVDLRNNDERAAQPTPWAELGWGGYWARDYRRPGHGDMGHIFTNDTLTHERSLDFMLKFYRDVAYDHVEAIRRLFRAVADGEGPVLFHCTSGKDRTGASAALLLSAAGASREAIVADYLATEAFDILASPAFRNSPPERREALRPIYSVHASYLDTMFDAIDARHGSVEAYLRDVLELQPGDLAALREQLVCQA